MTSPIWTGPLKSRVRTITTASLLLAGAGLFLATFQHRDWYEPMFVASAYYVLFALVTIYAAIQLSLFRLVPRAWFLENWPGLVTTLLVSVTVFASVDPALRVLSDESNLIGVSKNLFYHHTANFAVAGKWYYENYWDVTVVADRRPALFPFLVGLVHLVKGYRLENAFTFNAIVFVAFVFTCYRLGKSLGGQVFGVCAAVLAAANPNTLVAARSAGFDFLATFMILLSINSFERFLRERTPARFAIYALYLCMTAHVRYEGWSLLLVGMAVPIVLGLVTREVLRGYGWLYASFPLFLLPRYWQAIAKAKDAEQPLSASLFSVKDFIVNTSDYFSVVRHPLDTNAPHSPLLILLAVPGCVAFGFVLWRTARSRQWQGNFALAALIVAMLGAQSVINFSYNWGRPLHAAAIRLFIWLDTFLAFAAAFSLSQLGQRFPLTVAWVGRKTTAPLAVLLSVVLFAVNAPAASAARFTNALVLTREAAQGFRFFDRVNDKRILILCDRPGLYTIREFGANFISLVHNDRSALTELSRKLYQDVYLIQEIDLNTKRPLPDFDVWPDVELDVLEEFQNGDSSFVRISRVRKSALQ